jgi:tetratricopeptide (TPR) repeat protein
VFAFAYGGGYYTTTNDFSVSAFDPLVGGGAGLEFGLSPGWSIEVAARYTNYLGLWQGLSATLGTRFVLGQTTTRSKPDQDGGSIAPGVQPLAAPQKPAGQQRVDLVPNFPPAFSIFYKHYNDQPIGTVQITNHLSVPISNVKVQFFVKNYMDEPKEVEVQGTLSPESSQQVDVLALFNNSMLNITEGTKAAAQLVISYEAGGQVFEDKKIVTVDILGRNAMTWDDSRKAAAYVTAKDPGVLQFARSVTSQVRGWETRSINENLQAAIALHEALDLYGLDYVPNPITPYSEASKKKDVIDFLQFPRETFQYKAGDCSDISILYCALLQAVGIDTAFVTVPGHVFVAVNAGISPEQAEDALIPTSEYIAYKGKVWIPVEITLRHQGFFKAWDLGAKEWNENKPIGQAGFYPVQEAWTVFQPVGLPGAPEAVATPSSAQVLAAYKAEAQRYLDAAIAPQVALLQAQIQSAGNLQSEKQGTSGLAAMNRLGVLHAKYGALDKAEAAFKRVLAVRAYLPAILNLGNLYFIRNDSKAALAAYQRAYEMDPGNPHVLLAIARTSQDLRDYPATKKAYDQLKELDPNLAAQYAYLGAGSETGARASDIGTQRRSVLWEK